MLVNPVMTYASKIGIFGAPSKGVNLIIPLRTSYLIPSSCFRFFLAEVLLSMNPVAAFFGRLAQWSFSCPSVVYELRFPARESSSYMFTRDVSLSELAVSISLVVKFLLRAILIGFLLELPSSRQSGIGVGTFGLWEVESESRYIARSA